jgi:predicted transposase YdaD
MTNNSIRELYEDSLKVYRDLKNVIDTAELKGQKKGFEQGRKQGIEQGRKQGIEQGRKQGIEQGSVEERKKIAKTMKALNMPLEDISKATGMTIDEIVNL